MVTAQFLKKKKFKKGGNFPSGLPVVHPLFFSRATTSFEVWEKLFEVWGGLRQGASPCFMVDIGVSGIQEEVWQWFATFSHTLFAESERYQWGSARTPSGGAKTRLPSLPILLMAAMMPRF